MVYNKYTSIEKWEKAMQRQKYRELLKAERNEDNDEAIASLFDFLESYGISNNERNYQRLYELKDHLNEVYRFIEKLDEKSKESDFIDTDEGQIDPIIGQSILDKAIAKHQVLLSQEKEHSPSIDTDQKKVEEKDKKIIFDCCK